MKHFLYFCGLMLVFAACGTKKAATSGKTNTQSDLAYIQTFHNAMRYKVKGQMKIQFNFCANNTPYRNTE